MTGGWVISSRRFEFGVVFEGPIAENGAIPVEKFAKVLSALQQLLYLFAMENSSLELTSHHHVPRQIQENFELEFTASEICCFKANLALGKGTEELFVDSTRTEVLRNMDRFSRALSDENESGLRDIVNDDGYRKKILNGYQSLLPGESDGYELFIDNRSGGLSLFDSSSFSSKYIRSEIQKSDCSDAQPEGPSSIVGILSGIDFEHSRILVSQTGHGRKYFTSVDDRDLSRLAVLGNKLVRMTGLVSPSKGRKPAEVNQSEVENLDCSPVHLTEIHTPRGSLQLKESLSVKVSYEPDTRVLHAVNDRVNLDVYASNREELLIELQEELASIWRTYTQADPTDLTKGALILRENLTDLVDEP